jgi:hypothetical protein
LDGLIDGGNGATTGRVRWTASGPTDLNPADRVRLFLMASAK